MGARLKAVTVAVAFVLLALPAHAAGRAPVPSFTDVTAASGIHVTGLGNAASWVDFDGDGDLDLFLTNSDFPGKVWLYRNDGGVFADVTAAAGFAGVSLRSVAWGDFDRDGRPDLAATTYASNSRARLYRNEGDGTFTEVGGQAGLLTASLPWRIGWVDVDRDGWLDLYQANFGRNHLYRNDGDGTFIEEAVAAGVADPGTSTGGAWADFDGDGWIDLFVADEGADHLYRSDGDGTFTDVTASAGVSDQAESEAACWGDADGDGRPDLYVVDISGGTNHLYRNDGDGTFTDVTASAGVGDVGDGRTCAFVDVDQDGRVDLFATDHIHRSRLYRNQGGGTFVDVAQQANLAQPLDVFDGAWGDLDADGDLDLMSVGHFDNVLLRNDGTVGGSVRLLLVGTASNATAIGATAVLRVGGSAVWRQVEGSSGAYGQSSPVLTFGVGRATGPFVVRLRWPSGRTQTLRGVLPGATITVTEP